MGRVLISTSSFGAPARLLIERAGFECVLNPYGRKLEEAESSGLLEGVVGVVAGVEKLSREVLAGKPQLKVISRCGVGIDNVDLDAAKYFGIKVFNTPNAHVDAVAELTLGGILTAMRHVPASDRSIRSRGWKKPMGSLLRGKTVGVVGLGRVGKRLVSLLAPFEVLVLATDPAKDEAFATAHRVRWRTLEELFRECDVVSIHLPLTPSTKGLISGALLSSMKSGATFVNVGRGGVVDEQALFRLLQNDATASAYVDVFEEEPYLGPLATLENAVLTAHVGSYAVEAREAMELEAAENLLQGLRAS
ncbi:MAG: hydroxyacid dehydrogenase [Deltaproteobacteria bacterium]|nr:hydroxyacid dehydrogenase [Deltaproteobacteria bacterium]